MHVEARLLQIGDYQVIFKACNSLSLDIFKEHFNLWQRSDRWLQVQNQKLHLGVAFWLYLVRYLPDLNVQADPGDLTRVVAARFWVSGSGMVPRALHLWQAPGAVMLVSNQL